MMKYHQLEKFKESGEKNITALLEITPTSTAAWLINLPHLPPSQFFHKKLLYLFTRLFYSKVLKINNSDKKYMR
jgi:hypothetical protein